MDLPEVTLVAILDADREGYLRSYRSLSQIMGRAARNIDSKIILYADNITESISKAVNETKRRREKQIAYNKANNITPQSIIKDVADLLPPELAGAFDEKTKSGAKTQARSKNYLERLDVKTLEELMWDAVSSLDFEKAALIRDTIAEIEKRKSQGE